MWQIDFISDRFLPYLPEDSQANPGAYGFELALWLSQELMRRGTVTSYPLGEDWGWFIEYLKDDVELMICCGSPAEAGEGYRGQAIGWSIYSQAPGGWFKRRSGPAAKAAAAQLLEQVLSVLEDAGIEAERIES